MVYNDLFYPQHVLVFGSAKPGKLAAVIGQRLLAGGMKQVSFVNPKGQAIAGAQGYTAVSDIPEPAQLAIIASPAPTVAANLEACGQAGIKAAAIITSGFSEAGNKEGEAEILAVARKYGLRFVGPNCAGLSNTHSNLIATLETQPPAGDIAMISQSGAVGGSLMAMAKEQGLGISKFISFGNGLDLNMLEFLDWMKTDEETKVVAIYLESVPNGRQFMQTMAELAKIKPVVVVKAGRSSAGQRAALSHTGSMAGVDVVCDAALKQCGAIRVDTLEDMFDVCRGFSALPPMQGRRLLVVTNSGGPGVMATDQAELSKLTMAEPSEAMKKSLYAFLPDYASTRNPIDLTVEGTGKEYEEATCTALADYDGALDLYIGTPYLAAVPIAQGIINAAQRSGKPVTAVLSVGNDIEGARRLLHDAGIPCYVSGERAVKVLEKLADYYAWREHGAYDPAVPEPCGEKLPARTLLEPEAKDLLAQAGVPNVPYAFVHSAEEAARAGEQMGWPVVMKIVSPQILHKSDVGGVILHIDSAAAAKAAFAKLEAIGAGKDFRGAIISPMRKGEHEVIIGLVRDPSFGPVVVFGLGGIYTEVLKDVVFRVAPVKLDEARVMVHSIRTHKLLEGARGSQPIDDTSLAQAIVAVSELPFRYPQVKELDLNPVFAGSGGAEAVDARVVIA